MTSIKHGNVIERIALFGVAISFKSRIRVVAFSVTRLLKSRWHSRKYGLMHQAKWRDEIERSHEKHDCREISCDPRDIYFQRYMLLPAIIASNNNRKKISENVN